MSTPRVAQRMLWLGALMLLVVSPVLARNFRYEQSKIAFSVPDPWEVSNEAGRFICTPPEGNMKCILFPGAAQEWEHNSAFLDAKIETWVKKDPIEWEEECEEGEQNGVKFYIWTGTGNLKSNNGAIGFRSGVLEATEGRQVIFLFYWSGSAEQNELVKSEYERFTDSFSKIEDREEEEEDE